MTRLLLISCSVTKRGAAFGLPTSLTKRGECITMKRDWTNAQRQERHRQRVAGAGLKRVEVKVPAERADELREIAERMRLEALEIEGAQE